MSSLSERRCRPELMDDPHLEPARHAQALGALARINWVSGSDRMLWRPLAALARHDSSRVWRVLDVATGGGDVPVRLWRRARGAGVKLDIHGCDISPTALEVARHKARQAGADINYFQLDVLRDGIPTGFDVVACSLFLHHLSREHALGTLGHMRRAAGRMVLINDLRRCRLGFVLAWLAVRVLTTSAVARVDGPRSVEAAFTMAEVRALANVAGMEAAEIARRWPCRYLLTWRRP